MCVHLVIVLLVVVMLLVVTLHCTFVEIVRINLGLDVFSRFWVRDSGQNG